MKDNLRKRVVTVRLVPLCFRAAADAPSQHTEGRFDLVNKGIREGWFQADLRISVIGTVRTDYIMVRTRYIRLPFQKGKSRGMHID